MNMTTEISLPRLRIASPCPMSWDDMIGDDKVRHCGECNLNVYNFVEMEDAEIASILAEAEGRVCGRLHQRLDGTVLAEDCPVGLARVRRKLRRMAGAVAAGIALLFSAGLLLGGESGFSYRRRAASVLSRTQPIAWLVERFSPKPTIPVGRLITLGEVALPPSLSSKANGGNCPPSLKQTPDE